MRGRRSTTGYLLIVLSAALWGLLPLFTRGLITAGWSSLCVASVRSLLSAAVSLGCLLFCGELRKFRAKDIPFYLLYGIFAVGGTFLFYTIALQYLSSAMASVLLYMGPTFVNVLNRLVYKIPFTRGKQISLVVTLLGCALVVRLYDPASVSANLIGILCGLLSGFCYSLTTVIGEAAQSRYPGRVNSWLIMLFGSVAFLVAKPFWDIPVQSGAIWFNAICLAVIGSVIPYTLYLSGLEMDVDSGAASILSTLEVVFATCVGVACFHDPLEWQQLLGIAVVFAGIVIVRREKVPET